MAKLSILAGSTSVTVNLFIQDTTSTTGAGLTGLAYNTASFGAYYCLAGSASSSITLATLASASSSWSSGGFKEIDAANMPGWYRFDVPNAAIASGRFVSIHFQGAANMAQLPLEIELTAWDNQNAALSTAANAAIADKILGRNLAGGADGTRTVRDALRKLRNKTRTDVDEMTVYAEDDTTPAWTAVVTTDPVQQIDPS